MKHKLIPQEGLKLIACITMLIDHFGHAIVPKLPVPYMATFYYACRIIGRIAFPIYCFLLAEGMHHTRNPGKYIGRLAIGILLAELPFDILFEGGISWESQSVMVTLTLGAVMILCMQKTEPKMLKLLMVVPFAVAAELVKSDYGGWGIAMIAVFALFDRLPLQIAGLLLVQYLMNSLRVPFFGVGIPIQLFAVGAMIPVAFYSGQKLTRSRAIQWGFYLFYPVHLLLLWILLMILR